MSSVNYASVNKPTISEIINGFSISEDRAVLERRLSLIERTFTTVNKDRYSQVESGRVIFWVLGYQVTEPEKSKGIIGNHMACHIRESENGFFIEHEKILEPDPKNHPHRKHKVKGDNKYHPNSGVPAVRLALSQKPLESKEHAIRLLDELQQSYPEPTIRPYSRTLHTMIWKEGKPWKVTITVNYDPDGFYYLCLKDNHMAKNRNKRKRGKSKYNELFNKNLDQFVSETLMEVVSDV